MQSLNFCHKDRDLLESENLIRVSLQYQFPHTPHFFTFGSEGDVRLKNSGVEETKPARLECEGWN